MRSDENVCAADGSLIIAIFRLGFDGLRGQNRKQYGGVWPLHRKQRAFFADILDEKFSGENEAAQVFEDDFAVRKFVLEQ